MMKKVRILLLIFPLIASFLLVPKNVQAQENGYSITVQKYKLGEGVNLSTDVPQDGTKAEKVTDDKGNELEAFGGISYEIVRVSPMEGTSEFRPVEGADSFSTVITTNDQGIATAADLVAGTYRVTERPTDEMPNVMEPVTFELPLPQRTGEALSDVYLYPKSSIQTSPDGNIPKSSLSSKEAKEAKEASGTKGRLPQTSGNLGTMQPMYLLLALIVVMGAVGGYYMQTKKHHF